MMIESSEISYHYYYTSILISLEYLHFMLQFWFPAVNTDLSFLQMWLDFKLLAFLCTVAVPVVTDNQAGGFDWIISITVCRDLNIVISGEHKFSSK